MFILHLHETHDFLFKNFALAALNGLGNMTLSLLHPMLSSIAFLAGLFSCDRQGRWWLHSSGLGGTLNVFPCFGPSSLANTDYPVDLLRSTICPQLDYSPCALEFPTLHEDWLPGLLRKSCYFFPPWACKNFV